MKVSTNQSSAANAPRLVSGDIVTLAVNETHLKFLVAQAVEGKVALIPLQTIPSTEGLFGTSLMMDTSRGPVRFVGSSQVQVPAVVGVVQSARMGKEERQFYRVKPDFRIEVSFDGYSWRPIVGENVSEGGLAASCIDGTGVEAGHPVITRFYIPEGPPAVISGLVKRTESLSVAPNQVAFKFVVEFKTMSAADRHRLVQYIYHCQIKELQGK